MVYIHPHLRKLGFPARKYRRLGIRFSTILKRYWAVIDYRTLELPERKIYCLKLYRNSKFIGMSALASHWCSLFSDFKIWFFGAHRRRQRIVKHHELLNGFRIGHQFCTTASVYFKSAKKKAQERKEYMKWYKSKERRKEIAKKRAIAAKKAARSLAKAKKGRKAAKFYAY